MNPVKGPSAAIAEVAYVYPLSSHTITPPSAASASPAHHGLYLAFVLLFGNKHRYAVTLANNSVVGIDAASMKEQWRSRGLVLGACCPPSPPPPHSASLSWHGASLPSLPVCRVLSPASRS
jgi:hypothetical protein